MVKKLQDNPLYFLLLPVFFVLHGYMENYEFIAFRDCWSLFGIYIGAAVILYFFSWLFLRKRSKAALLSAFIMGFFLFFGAIHDFLRRHSIVLHRYSVILPSFLVLAILLLFYLKRKNSGFPRATLFFNTLMLLYLLVDGGSLFWKGMVKSKTASPELTAAGGLSARCDTCSKPDIYLILFDCYSGNSTLSNLYHYNNSAFHEYLEREGFHVQRSSRSNYPYTPLSMASMLNLSYLENMSAGRLTDPYAYVEMVGYIAKCRVATFLHGQGYTISNYSPYDLPGSPSPLGQSLTPVKTKLITNRTLFGYAARDLETWALEHFEDSAVWRGGKISEMARMNDQFLAATKEESARQSNRPRFIYTHVYMPHFPFFYDSLMRRRPLSDVASHYGDHFANYYLQYLPYTNSRARDLIATIKKNTGGRAVILFMSDHGLRPDDDKNGFDRSVYANQNAVYFPDRDYSLLYDSISNVNQFRVVFDKLFHLNLPLLKDSSLFLHEDR